MFQGHRVGAILLMGGEGIRFGIKLPKQFHHLGGKPLYRYALETFLESGYFDEIVLVCHSDWMANTAEDIRPGVRVVPGGASRQESSFAGLKAFSPMPRLVLIHDAVRPFATKKILKDNLDAALACGAADTCIPSADTLVFAPGGALLASIPKREDFRRGQTPQTFRTDWIVEAHEKARREGVVNASDDCRLVLEAGHPVAVVAGSEENFKITSEFDLVLAEALLEKRSRNHHLERSGDDLQMDSLLK